MLLDAGPVAEDDECSVRLLRLNACQQIDDRYLRTRLAACESIIAGGIRRWYVGICGCSSIASAVEKEEFLVVYLASFCLPCLPRDHDVICSIAVCSGVVEQMRSIKLISRCGWSARMRGARTMLQVRYQWYLLSEGRRCPCV